MKQGVLLYKANFRAKKGIKLSLNKSLHTYKSKVIEFLVN